MERHLPLSDDIHGPYKMMPPEHLHTSGGGLIMYDMFELLRTQLEKGKDRDEIDHQHIVILNLVNRQSERDFPWGSIRNGLIDGKEG
jgi:hypothetical protein